MYPKGIHGGRTKGPCRALSEFGMGHIHGKRPVLATLMTECTLRSGVPFRFVSKMVDCIFRFCNEIVKAGLLILFFVEFLGPHNLATALAVVGSCCVLIQFRHVLGGL